MDEEMKIKGAIPERADLIPGPEKAKEIEEVEEAVDGVTELSLESLQVQIDGMKFDIAQIKARTGTPRVRTQAEVDTLVKQADAEAALTADQRVEKEIRKYVKRNGGYRKDITKPERALAGRLLKKLGRDGRNPTFDTELLP